MNSLLNNNLLSDPLSGLKSLVNISNLSKKYNKILALDDISIQIPKGKIVGLLGPNGSGKTTLMKILSGLICNYKGEVLINGQKPGDYTKSIVSYLPDKPCFADWMSAKDVIKIYKDFFEDFDEIRINKMFEQLGLDFNQKIKTMSKGTIEKVQLCLTMSRQSLLYVLDEPIGGVDPAARDYILTTIIQNYNPEGTVLIATHLVEEVEKIFDAVIFVKQGKITLFEEVDSVRENYGKSVDQLFREEFRCF